MSAATVRVKCKSCETAIPVEADSPREAGDDGVSRVRLTCPRCRKEAAYRFASDVPRIVERPVEIRLPRIVLQAAWWVRFSLIAAWLIVWVYITISIFAFLMVVVHRY